jgi:3-mercaptopyruvate sulfurtransferase SseA
MNRIFHWRKYSLLVGLALTATLILGGCGTDSYDDPTAQRLTITETPLITAETLKIWVDQGLVNSDATENVVILATDTVANYTAAHIPGAYLWDSASELTMTRLEGLAEAGSSVATGGMVDQVLQRSGVKKNSTIVITYTGTNLNNPARAYFTLRYWGFPKERIKMLNGGNPAWAAAVTTNTWDAETYGLTAIRPLNQTSNTFSVRENKSLRTDLRYSIGEMIQVIDSNNASITATSQPKINIIQQTSSTPALATAIGRAGTWFVDNGYFRTAEEIKAILLNERDAVLYPGLEAIPLGPGDFVEGLPSITHCVTGISCTPIYFAVDAILGWDIAVYDGSTNQWNAYKNRASGVVANAAWRTDLYGRSNGVQADYTGATLIDPDLNFHFQTVNDPRANQTENEDILYMAPPASGPPSSIGVGDQSGC